MPDAVVGLLCGALGLLVGSFLNVVVARVPAGESVVLPGSRCPRCGTPIAPRDNVPVVSWLLLRGRSRCCGLPISRRYPLVEAGTAVAFAGVGAWVGASWVLPALLYLAGLSVALALIDIDVHRLPDVIVLPSYPVAAVLLAGAALAEDRLDRLARAAVGAVLLYLFYRLLKLVADLVYGAGGFGMGDVKLAGLLGGYLAFDGWAALAAGTFAGFLVGGVVSLGLLATGRAGRRTAIPFGPYMLVGAWLGLVAGQQIVESYLRATGLQVGG